MASPPRISPSTCARSAPSCTARAPSRCPTGSASCSASTCGGSRAWPTWCVPRPTPSPSSAFACSPSRPRAGSRSPAPGAGERSHARCSASWGRELQAAPRTCGNYSGRPRAAVSRGSGAGRGHDDHEAIPLAERHRVALGGGEDALVAARERGERHVGAHRGLPALLRVALGRGEAERAQVEAEGGHRTAAGEDEEQEPLLAAALQQLRELVPQALELAEIDDDCTVPICHGFSPLTRI